jgi:hypothetical protein
VTDVGRAVLAADLEMDAPKHVFLMLFMLVDKRDPRRLNGHEYASSTRPQQRPLSFDG